MTITVYLNQELVAALERSGGASLAQSLVAAARAHLGLGSPKIREVLAERASTRSAGRPSGRETVFAALGDWKTVYEVMGATSLGIGTVRGHLDALVAIGRAEKRQRPIERGPQGGPTRITEFRGVDAFVASLAEDLARDDDEPVTVLGEDDSL